MKAQQLQAEREGLSLDLINAQAMCSDLQQRLNQEMAAKVPVREKVEINKSIMLIHNAYI